MSKIKSTILAASVLGLLAMSPAVAQNQQIIDIVTTAMTELGVDSAEIDKVAMANEEQLQQLQIIVEGSADEQAKKDQLAAILAEVH